MAELAFPVLNTLILGSALVAGVIDYIRTNNGK